jgi:hypothetical protein
MTLTRGFTDDIKLLAENEQLGALENELFSVTLERIGMSASNPLSLYASFPTADALLHIGSSLVEAGDGSGKSIPPINSILPSPTSVTTINFQTGAITGQTVTVDGGSFALPAGTSGRYRRWVAVLRSDGTIDSTFSAEALSVAALDNAGTLLFNLQATAGLSIGWVDLQCDNALGMYRTAGSGNSIIENKVGTESRIFRFGTGGGDLKSLLDAEITARMAADSSLQSGLNQETSSRIVADSSLYAAISLETSTRMVADSSLSTLIGVEQSARVAADSSLTLLITLETSTRLASDSSLAGAIDDEMSSRMEADSSLQSHMYLMDSSLQAAILVEGSSRIVADSSLQSLISVEQSSRLESDSSLYAVSSSTLSALNAEYSARVIADSSLQLELDTTQVSLGSAVDGSGGWVGFSGTNYLDSELTFTNSFIELDAAVVAEVTSRKVADSSLVAVINLEASAREEADSSLMILILTSVDSTLQASLEAEISARKAGDSSLTVVIDLEYSARLVADSSLQLELDVTQGSLGDAINGDGSWSGFSGTTYLETALTFTSGLEALDIGLATEVTARQVADSSLVTSIANLDVHAFEFKSIASENLTIAKGYMVIAGDGREIYSASDIVYDLSGLVSDGDYYGYIDLNSLGLPTIVNGRKVIVIDDTNFFFSTTTPDGINLEQYYPQGLVRRVSGSWVAPVTLAFKRHASGGAGGDASFKVSSVAADGTTVIKGGYIALNYDAIMATYDGTGTTEADFGKDLTLDLDTYVTPVNNTTYYLYVDIYSLPAEITLTDSGRQLIPVISSNFVLLTQDFEEVYQYRYAKIGVVRRDVGVWSTTIAISYPQKKQIYPSAFVAPTIFAAEQVIGSVGSVGQISAGHVLASTSFPAAHYSTKISYYNLSGLTDGNTSLGHDLTNNGSTPFTGTGIVGAANSCANLNGTSHWLNSTDGHFNPSGIVDWIMGGWFKPTSYTPLANQTLFSSWAGSGNQKFSLELTPQGNLQVTTSTTGSNSSSSVIVWGSGSGWNHIALRYDAADQDLYVYINSVLLGIHPVGAALYQPASPDFCLGARSGGTSLYAGLIDEFFASSGYGLNDSELAKVYAAKIAHPNALLTPKHQNWQATVTYSDLVAQLDVDFVIDMDEAALYLDLSGQSPLSIIYLTLQNTSVSGGTSVSITRMFEATAATIDSWGTFTHNLPATPTVMALLVDDGAGYYEHHDASAYFKANASYLAPIGGSNLTTILGASTNVKLLVSVGPAAIYSPPDSVETSARINADLTLQSNINIETSARISADLTLQANINTLLNRQVVSSNSNATNLSTFHVDTTSAPVTITLPATPSSGWAVTVADAKNSFAVNNCTIGRNSSNISGAASDFICDISGKIYTLVYIDGSYGWEVYF